MTAKPPLPDNYELPGAVNGWEHAPESNKNGHIWLGPDGDAAVGVFGFAGEIVVKLLDERVTGLGGVEGMYVTEYEHKRDYYSPVDDDAPAPAVVDGINAAVDWMQRNAPPWRHPAVEPGAFDAPAGFTLDRYYLEARKQIVCYRQEGTESEVSLSGRRLETEPSLETRKYLYVEAWRGSGNATVSLAPWLRAHDHEQHEVVDTPEECGLSVALKLARDWVAEQTGESRDDPARGQTGLGAWIS